MTRHEKYENFPVSGPETRHEIFLESKTRPEPDTRSDPQYENSLIINKINYKFIIK